MKCLACVSADTKEIINDKLVTFLFPVSQSTLERVTRENISIFICQNCSHVFQTNVDKDLINKIYSDFYKHYNLDTSEEFQSVYRQRTIDFINESISDEKNNNNRNFLDIGCGEGTYFPYFSDLGFNCFGFEPSQKHKIAIKNNPNVNVSPDYFEDQSKNAFGETFQVILLNWVLEHVIDLESFFKKLINYCHEGTKIIFQVPDFEYYIDNDLHLFYVHEHIHYFSPASIEKCLNRFGFKLLKYKNGDCPSLLVFAEYSNKTAKELNKGVNKNIEKVDIFLKKGLELGTKANELLSHYDEVYFYGIGTPSYWLGEYYLDEKVKKKIKIIDDNKFYIEKYAPSFNHKIQTLSNVNNVNNAVFFIGTSPVYRKVIVDKLLKNVKGNFEVLVIDNNRFKVLDVQNISL